MDEATLAVVGSIAAALLGALVGAAINQRAARALEDRRDEREAGAQRVRFRAAARLVFIELRLAQLAVDSMLKRRTFIYGIGPPGTAWATHGVRLAGELSEVEYDAVASACGKVAVWFGAGVPSVDLETITDFSEVPDAERVLRDLSEEIDAAIAVLHPIGYPESTAAAAA